MVVANQLSYGAQPCVIHPEVWDLCSTHLRGLHVELAWKPSQKNDCWAAYVPQDSSKIQHKQLVQKNERVGLSNINSLMFLLLIQNLSAPIGKPDFEASESYKISPKSIESHSKFQMQHCPTSILGCCYTRVKPVYDSLKSGPNKLKSTDPTGQRKSIAREPCGECRSEMVKRRIFWRFLMVSGWPVLAGIFKTSEFGQLRNQFRHPNIWVKFYISVHSIFTCIFIYPILLCFYLFTSIYLFVLSILCLYAYIVCALWPDQTGSNMASRFSGQVTLGLLYLIGAA